MWAHYADGHRGYCLEFSTLEEPLSHAEQVSYVSQLARFSPYSRQHPDDERAVPLLTKHVDWSYEKEWRIIAHEEANRGRTYPVTALTGVYLGAHIRPRNEALIRGAVARGGLSPKFYRMKVSRLALVATPDSACSATSNRGA